MPAAAPFACAVAATRHRFGAAEPTAVKFQCERGQARTSAAAGDHGVGLAECPSASASSSLRRATGPAGRKPRSRARGDWRWQRWQF
jgi:hypothetical protein